MRRPTVETRVVCRSFRRPVNRRKIAGSVENAHNLRSVFSHLIERQPAVDDKRPRAGRNVGSRRTEMWMLFEARATLFDAVEDRIGEGLGMPLGNVKPNIEKVVSRMARIMKLPHALKV
jgi:hypothetical protein